MRVNSLFGFFYKKVNMSWFWSKMITRFASRNKKGEEILGYLINSFDELIEELQEYAEVEKVLSEAKSKQITLLKEREKANEELIKTLQPKWYENTYLWLGIGFILGKI